MYRLTMGLGYSIFRLFLMPYSNENQELKYYISQHKIVLSDMICDYYREKAGDNSDAVDMYITANASYDCFEYVETVKNNSVIENEFVSLVSRFPMKIMLTEKTEFSKKSLNRLKEYSASEVLTDKANPVRLYSFPISNLEVNIGDKRDRYLTWFKHLLEGEKHVCIIDSYIITKKGLDILNQCYLPIIEAGAQIDIYGTDSNAQNGWTVEELDKRINRNCHTIELHVIPREKEHERFIWAGDIKINIGRGLDFVDGQHETIQRKTYISISKEKYSTPI